MHPSRHAVLLYRDSSERYVWCCTNCGERGQMGVELSTAGGSKSTRLCLTCAAVVADAIRPLPRPHVVEDNQ